MTIDQLPQYCTDLVAFLATTASKTATGVPSVMRLYGGDLAEMPSPSLGVFMQVPEPNMESIRIYGNDAMNQWRISIILVSEQTATMEEGMIWCMTKLRIIKGLLDWHPTRAWSDMQPALEFFSFYDNSVQSTIMSLNYVVNIPF
jgi:hypothetical protein